METVVIIYTSESAHLKTQVEELRAALDPSRFSVEVKEASRASIPDVAAADIVIMGGQENAEVPADFSGLVRAFRGVNLAGKTAAFFSPGPDKTSARLRKTMKDTDITTFDDDLVLQGGQVPVKTWAEKLLAFHASKQNG